jgi:hypothetical protein
MRFKRANGDEEAMEWLNEMYSSGDKNEQTLENSFFKSKCPLNTHIKLQQYNEKLERYRNKDLPSKAEEKQAESGLSKLCKLASKDSFTVYNPETGVIEAVEDGGLIKKGERIAAVVPVENGSKAINFLEIRDEETRARMLNTATSYVKIQRPNGDYYIMRVASTAFSTGVEEEKTITKPEETTECRLMDNEKLKKFLEDKKRLCEHESSIGFAIYNPATGIIGAAEDAGQIQEGDTILAIAYKESNWDEVKFEAISSEAERAAALNSPSYIRLRKKSNGEEYTTRTPVAFSSGRDSEKTLIMPAKCSVSGNKKLKNFLKSSSSRNLSQRMGSIPEEELEQEDSDSDDF